MAAVSHNHAHYQERIDYIKQILADYLHFCDEDIDQTKIFPIQYEEDCPFKYNNFVYRLSLPTDISGGLLTDADGSRKSQFPCCVPIPPGTRDFVLRMSNPDAEGLHQGNRVQNEVGILTLASAALSGIKPSVVPRVFGWHGASRDQPGWILEELMPGAPLAETFGTSMSLDEKKGILAQMAELLKALQDYELPGSIEGWGGVTISDGGAIVSAPMTSVGAGPWSSFEDSYRGRLEVALGKADRNPYLQGWRANGVRERIDAFIERGLAAQFSDLASKQARTIVHADFTTDNILYDPATGRITALLDYDFASILHPAYEFLRSFNRTGGRLSGWLGDATPQEKEAAALRNAKLTGQFPSPLPSPVSSGNGRTVDWELAQAWDSELQRLDVMRPSSIRGIDKIADFDEVLGALVPWTLLNEDYLRMNPDEDQRWASRLNSEKQLVGLLSHLGF